jgi:hypothetical protein
MGDYIQILNLLVAVIGGIFIAWYWNDEKHRLDEFRYVDEAYIKLLERYFANPRFGDPKLTNAYAQSFTGEEGLRYHYFAMAVHTVMETVFDVYKPRRPKWMSSKISRPSEIRIPEEWIQIFKYHTMLHVAWLKGNTHVHEPGYVALVLDIEGRKHGAL